MWIQLALVACFFVLWTRLYEKATDQFYTRGDEWACRVVTIYHAVTVVLLSALCWFLGSDPFNGKGGPSSYLEEFTAIISLGYFIFDLVWCIKHQTEGTTMLIHHLISIIVLATLLIKGTGGTEATGGLFCLEITNPFLQIRWLIRSAGYGDTIFYKVAEITFVTLFVFFRMFWFTYLTFCILINFNLDLCTKLGCLVVYGLSWVFLVHIGHFCADKYVYGRRRRRSVVPSRDDPNPLGFGTRVLRSSPWGTESVTRPNAPSTSRQKDE